MVNEILMRGSAPVVPTQPVATAPEAPAGDAFARTLLAELEGPAATPREAPPARAITLDTLPVVPPPMLTPPAPPVVAPAPAAQAEGRTYTVQAGDSLSKIARRLGHGSWRQLYAANRAVVGADPNVIHPGQVLTLPASWQSAAVAPTRAARGAGPTVQAAVEPPARAAAAPGGPATAAARLAEQPAPTVAAPVLPLEATVEPQPKQAPLAEPVGGPGPAEIAAEAIDRLSAEPGAGKEHVLMLREALKSIPPEHPSYEKYRAKVEAYESAVGGAPQAVGAPPVGGGAGSAAPAEGAYGPPAPADAAPRPAAGAPATVQAPLAPQPLDEAGDADADGEEGWQAFS